MLRKTLFAAASLAAASVFFSAPEASAQTPYEITHSVGTYTAITGGTTYIPVKTLPGSIFDAWDEGYATIPLPFSVSFFQNSYSTVYAYTNGFLSFQPPGPNVPSVIGPPGLVPNINNPIHDFIGVMWADLTGLPNGEIRAEIMGTAPNRTAIIQYGDFQTFAGASDVNFQLHLHEASGAFEIVMGANFGVINATTAIEDDDGDEGFNLHAPSATCVGTCTCNPGTCQSANWQPAGFTISVQLPNAPELTGTITAPPGAYPGTNFDVTLDIRNVGLQPSGPFDYRLYLATTDTTTVGATILGTFPRASQPATSETTLNRSVMMPSVGVGTYFVAAMLDVNGDVDEVIETNNLIFSDAIATAPDLSGSVGIPAETGPGEVFDVDFTLSNSGAPVTDPISVSFYFSADQTWDVSDDFVHGDTFTLPDGFLLEQVLPITTPMNIQPSPPNYYLIARIDDQGDVTETDETNNDVVSDTTIEVNGPEVSTETFIGGDFGFRGLPYPITMDVSNSGGTTARDFTVCVVLSDNLLISLVTDEIIEITPLITLAPGEVRTFNLEPLIPIATATGAWFVAGVSDCNEVVTEANETNNTNRRPASITVRDPAADFVPQEVTTTSVAGAGEMLPVAVRFSNLGNAADQTQFKLVLSDNPGATDLDPSIFDSTTAITLDPPEETTQTVWATLPSETPSGLYYIGAILDPDDLVDEIYEDNNVVTAGPITVVGSDVAIVTPAPPPVIIEVAYAQRFAAVGGVGDYVWTIAWADAQPDGLTFDGAIGELSGTAPESARGNYDFTLSVTSGNLSASRDYTLFISPPTIGLEIISSRLPPAVALEPYQVQVIAVGGLPPYRFNATSQPPAGIEVAADGLLGGEPQIPGAYTFQVSVRDATGALATGLLALDIVDPNATVSITTADVPDGEVGIPFETAFAAAGGEAPYVWRLTGEIPGLTFDADTASLTGTPTVAGDYPIIVEVRDQGGLLDRNAYVLSVIEEGTLQITTGQDETNSLPNGKVGEEYLDSTGQIVRLRAVKPGGLDGLRWEIFGELPSGLDFDRTEGTIAGTPTEAGVYPFIVEARDRTEDFARTSLAILIEADEVTGPGPGDEGCSCNAGTREGAPRGFIGLVLGLGVLLLRRRRRRSYLSATIALAVLVTAPAAEAQIVPYQVIESTEPFVPLGAGAVAFTPALADGNTQSVTLPFDFYLYGETFNTIWVNANGLVAVTNMGSGLHFPTTSNPSTFSPNGYIAPLWSDWCSGGPCGQANPNPGMGVFYEIDAIEEKVTFEFRNIYHFSDFTTAANVNFQVTLFGGLSSRIVFSYGPMQVGTGAGGGSGSYTIRMGMENDTGTNGMWIGPCSGPTACDSSILNSLENNRIEIIADAGEDVAASGVSVPAVAYPGLPMTSSFRLISRHQNPLGPFRYAFYLLAATTTSTTGGVLVFTSDPVGLAGFESRDETAEFEVPNDLPVGQYRVAAVADSAAVLTETDEGNNIAISAQSVRIADRAPDFVIEEIRPQESEVRPGDMINVVYRVENFGNEPGELELQLVLSNNTAITPSDASLADVIAFSTTPREVLTGTIAGRVPVGTRTGAYYVGLIADPSLSVPELSESNNIGRSGDSIIVSSAGLEIVDTTLPPGLIGRAYSVFLRAAGGDGAFEFTLVDGEVPRGMVFETDTGELHGIPLATGTFPFEFEVTSGGQSARKLLELIVIDEDYPLTVVTSAVPDGVLGSDYAVQLVAVGGQGPYVWRLVDGRLPSGVALAENGTIFGNPSMAGYSTFSAEVRDNLSTTATVALNVEIRAPGNLTITSSELPDAVLDEPYSQELFAAGGIRPITWREITVVPAGLSLDSPGNIGGIPEVAGDYRVRIEATDAVGNVDTNEIALSVVSRDPFSILTDVLPEGQPGEDYRAIISARGGDKPYTWELRRGEGFLPEDFDVRQGDGVITGETDDDLVIKGTFEAEGVWSFTARVTDAKGRFDERPFALISRIPPPPTINAEDDGCACSAAPHSGARSPLIGLGLLLGLLMIRRRKAKRGTLAMLALASILFLGARADAQVYVTTQYGSAYVPLANGTTIGFGGSLDDGVELITLPFSFNYYAEPYDAIYVSVNGIAALAKTCMTAADCGGGFCSGGYCESSISYTSAPLPQLIEPYSVLAVFWDDMNHNIAAPASVVRTETLGTAPNREFVIEWSNIAHYNIGATQSRANYQIRLDESSGSVRYAYGPFLTAIDDASWDTAAIGIQDFGGLEGLNATIPCAATALCGAADLVTLNNQVVEFGLPNGPELVGAGTSPTGGDPLDPISIDVTARNIGTQPAGAFAVEVYFSTDNMIDPTDDLLGTLNFPAIANGAEATLTLNTAVPNVAPGIYTIGAIVDSANAVVESIETNNTVLITTTFLVGADLSVEVPSLPDTGPGEAFSLDVNVISNGSAQAAVGVAVYLSEDQVLDASDRLIGTATTAIPAAPSTIVAVAGVVPVIVPGTYYTIAKVDASDLITEAVETNNTAVSVERTVITGADVVGVSIVPDSMFAFRGEMFRVTVQIDNTGGAASGDFFYGVYISDNQLFNTITDPELGRFGPVNLDAGETLNITLDVPIAPSIQSGLYFLAIIGDNTDAVLEEDEVNNTGRAAGQIEVRDPTPDLSPTAIRVPLQAAAGESMFVERTISNLGNAPGAGSYYVYLSEDSVFEPARDLRVLVSSTSLGAFGDDSGADLITLSSTVPPGSYFVAYSVDQDQQQAELFEDNNVLVSDATVDILPGELTILTDELPLATVGVAYDVVLAAGGGEGALTWALTGGNLPTGLTLDTTGRITGTPEEEGIFMPQFTVEDGTTNAVGTLRLVSSTPTLDLEIVSRSILPAFVNREFSYPLTAFGGVPPYEWSFDGTMPAGLQLSTGGVLAGFPTAIAAETINFRVEDALGDFAERPIAVRVVDSTDGVRFSNDVLSDGVIGEQYDQMLRVADGTGESPFDFAFAGGVLPPGLVLDFDNVQGIPTQVGVYSFAIRVTDNRGDSDLNRYVVEINELNGVQFVTTSLPTVIVNEPFVDPAGSTVVIRAVSSMGMASEIEYQLVSGDLPPGIQLAPDGTMEGTPTSSGIYSFAVQATDPANQTAVGAFGISVEEPPPAPPGNFADDGCACEGTRTSANPISLALLGIFGVLLACRRRWTFGFALVFALGVSQVSWAQVPYNVETFTETYVLRTGGTQVPFPSTDDDQATVPIPFTFRFFENDYTSVNVGTNGYVSFSTPATSLATQSFPQLDSPNDVIAVFWDDLDTAIASTYLEGVAPNRVFVIQYDNLQAYFAPTGGSTTIQIHLYEGLAGRFEIRYGPTMNMLDPFPWAANAGYENDNGTLGENLLPCSPNCTGTDLVANENLVIRVQQDGGTDVVASGIEPNGRVFAGVETELTVDLSSVHLNPLGPFVYGVYLVPAGSITLDTLVYTSGATTLTPYQQRSETPLVAPPLQTLPGRYRYALVTDLNDDITEPDEQNNVIFSSEFILSPPQPDFRFEEVRSSTGAASPGDQITVELDLRNNGNESGVVEWRAVLSRNAIITPDDRSVGTGTIAIDLLTTETVTVDVTLPVDLAAGDYYVGGIADVNDDVVEISELNNSLAAAQPLRVRVLPFNVTSSQLPVGFIGQSYSTFLSATGGEGEYVWALESGTLPGGMSLLGTGEIIGTPNEEAQAMFTVRVTSGSDSATASLELIVVPLGGGLTIVTRELLPGIVGNAYPPAAAGTAPEMQQHIVAVGQIADVTFSLSSPPPPGLTLDEDGYLHGTPLQTGRYDLDVEATDGRETALRTIPLTVAEPGKLTLISGVIPEAQLSQNFMYQLRAIGQSGTATVTFSTGGPLPDGLALTDSGLIVGIPQAVGSWVFAVLVTEGVGPAAPRDSALFRINVVQDAGFGLAPTTLAEAEIGKLYEASIGAREGIPPFSWRIMGPSLPPGLSFEVSTEERSQIIFKGVPESATVVSFLVVLDDGDGRHIERPYTIAVRPPVVPIQPPTEEGCTCGAAGTGSSRGSVLAILLGLFALRRRRAR